MTIHCGGGQTADSVLLRTRSRIFRQKLKIRRLTLTQNFGIRTSLVLGRNQQKSLVSARYIFFGIPK